MYSDIFIIHFSGIKSRNRSYILVKIHYFLFLSAILYSIMMKFIRLSIVHSARKQTDLFRFMHARGLPGRNLVCFICTVRLIPKPAGQCR